MSGTPALPPTAGRDPPWLEHAGLPNDGSVDAAGEIEAFCALVRPTHVETAQRAAMRSVVQKLVQRHLSPEATTKLVGSCALGVDTHRSGLDLAVEVSAAPEADPLAALQGAFAELGVPAAIGVRHGRGVLRVPASGLQVIAGGWSSATFDAVINVSVGHSPERACAAVLSQLLRRPACSVGRDVTRVVHTVLGQSRVLGDEPGALPSHAATLLVLSFIEARAESPLLRDAGLVLREFFRFYADFDWEQCSVALGQGPYVAKRHPTDPASIVDPVVPDHNVAAGLTRLPQLRATLRYVTTCIQRHDRVGRRSLLASIVAHGDLWARREALGGGAAAVSHLSVTKDFARELVRDLRKMLEQPVNAEVRGTIVRALSEDGSHQQAKELLASLATPLIQGRVAAKPTSRLAPFRRDPGRLAECIFAMRDEPEVQEELLMLSASPSRSPPDRPVAASPPPLPETAAGPPPPQPAPAGAARGPEVQPLENDDVVEMFRTVADFLEDPRNGAIIKEVHEKLDISSHVEARRFVIARIVEHRVAQKPTSKMAQFLGDIPGLTDAVFQIAAEDPAVQEQLLRISTLDALWAWHLRPLGIPELEQPPASATTSPRPGGPESARTSPQRRGDP